MSDESQALVAVEQPKAIAIIDRIDDLPAWVDVNVNYLKESGLPGFSNPGIAFVAVMHCLHRNKDLMEFVSTHHIIAGRIVPTPHTMLARFDNLRNPTGSHRILVRTPEKVGVELRLGNDVQQFHLTWEEFQREPVPYKGDPSANAYALSSEHGVNHPALQMKWQYATPHSRMQMLWARLVGDAVRAMAPGVIPEIYNAEEVADYSGEPLPAAAASPVESVEPSEPQAIDAEFEVVDDDTPEAQPAEPEEAPAYEKADTDPCGDDLASGLVDAMVAAGKPVEEATKILCDMYGVETLQAIPDYKAREWIERLQGEAQKKQADQCGEQWQQQAQAPKEDAEEPPF